MSGMSLRRLLVDMIEEYARHTGQRRHQGGMAALLSKPKDIRASDDAMDLRVLARSAQDLI